MTSNWPAQLGKLATVTTAVAVQMGKHSSYNATSGALAPALPALTSGSVATALAAGQVVRARVSKSKADTTANAVTVTCAGSDTFEGGTTTAALLAAGEKLTISAQPNPAGAGYVWVVEEHTFPRDTADARYPTKAQALGYALIFGGN